MGRIKTKELLLGAVILGLFLFLRLYRLEERINFSMDQGIFLLKAHEIWDNQELTLLGPTASPIVEGRQFFQGPIIYYWIMAAGLVANWNPIVIGYVFVGLNLISSFVLYKWVLDWKGKEVAIRSVFVWTVTPLLVDLSPVIWNPNLLLIMIPIWWFYTHRYFSNKTPTGSWLVGILTGMMLQLHYQVILLIFILGILIVLKKVRIRQVITMSIGVIVGYLPLVVFDLRNDFYNSKTFFQWLIFPKHNGFQLHSFYLIVLIPPIVAIAGTVIKKMNKWGDLALIGVITLLLLMTVKQKQAWGMPPNLNWNDLEKVAKIAMANGCKNDYNVASTVNGDTRAYNIRAILTIKNCPPLKVDQYKEAKNLILLAPKNRRLENEKVWEVVEFGGVVEEEIILNDNFIVYKLIKP